MNIDFKVAVLLISIYFLPEPGGGATAALNRATLLKKLGYRVFVITGFPTYPQGKLIDNKYSGKNFYIEDIQGLTVIRLKLLMLKQEGYLKRLIIFLNFIIASIIYMPRIIKVTGKVDIIYALAPILFAGIIGYIYSKFLNAFFIYDVPDLWPEELIAFKTKFSFIIAFIGKIFAKSTYNSPNIIITISASAAKIIREKYSPKVSIYNLPIGVDPTLFHKLDKNECRNKLINEKIYPKEFKDKFIIVYTGLISRAQKVENLLILARKLEKDSQIIFVVVGGGEGRQHIEKEINTLKNVFLLPYQPRNIIPYIIYSSDICSVLLSSEPIFEIAFPTKFYEYLACKKPMIGICKGEMAETINKYNLGYAVPLSKIDSLIPFITKIKDIPTLNKDLEKNFDIAINEFSLNSLAVRLKTILNTEMKPSF